jgi:hypothetical protein
VIHPNSTASYQDHKETGKAEVWRKRVFDAYAYSDKPRTDRAVIISLGADDFNLIRPEITRLVQDGILREVGKVKCVITGKTVRICEWTGKAYYSKGNKRPFFIRELVGKQAQASFIA